MPSIAELSMALNYLKMLIVTFIIGTILLLIGSLIFIPNTTHRWVLLGIYTWSGGLFIIYKIFRILKDSKQDGTLKK